MEPVVAFPPVPTLLELRFWYAAAYHAARSGFGIALPCEGHLRGFIAKGVRALEQQGFASDEDRINITEAHLLGFVSQMVIRARELGHRELHEDTFFHSLKLLCPLWPFC